MIGPPSSIGYQIDASFAHLNERLDRIASDLAHNSAQIQTLKLQIIAARIAIAILAGVAGIELAIRWNV